MSNSFNFAEFERQEAAREEHADAKWALEQQKKRAAAETLMVYLTWTAIEGRDLKALTELLEVSRDGSR